MFPVASGMPPEAQVANQQARNRVRNGSTNINAQPFNFDQFRDFGDTVFQEYDRTTRPEIERRRARMNQDLVNRGINPGSAAYDREMRLFSESENDLFNTAQRNAVTQGLAAQNQAFGQAATQAQINAALEQALIGANAQIGSAGIGAAASRYGADQNREGALERLMASLGEQGRQFDLGLSENQRQFNTSSDNALLLELLGFGQSVTNQNNQALASDRAATAGLFGLIPQGIYSPIDVTGAYGQNLQGQLANQQAAVQGRNGLFGSIGQIGGGIIGLNPWGIFGGG